LYRGVRFIYAPSVGGTLRGVTLWVHSGKIRRSRI